jgi:ketosteroid isomerase-like protein
MTMTQEQMEIRAAEQRRFDAMVGGDVAALDEILSEDLTYVHATATFETKADFLRRLRTGDLKYEAMGPESQEVRVYGSTGVVTGIARVQVMSGGKLLEFRMRYTDVYVKRGNRWQMVAWQATRLPQD